ncbi:MAG: carboxypeptidase regulatory-like domain-containing protein [Deltaproteobacteria bacterium]|nr:carboxypeptidase regulatory-like domain-containing protein [Deltaproteobacteria bacterium]
MSRRTVSVAIAGALLVGALVYVFGIRSASTTAPTGGGSGSASPANSAAPTAAPRTRPPSADLLRDDDRRGTLRLEGQVVDEAGAPVAGAIVAIDARPARTATTEDDGSFALEGLIGRTYELVATHGDAAAGPVLARLTEATGPIVLRLVRGATLEVAVTAAKQPVSGAEVELRGTVQRTAATDAAGVARFTGLPAGGYRLTAASAGYARRRGRSCAPGHTARGLPSRRAPSYRGVVDPDRRPVAGAQVSYAGVSDWGQSGGDAPTTTGADGTFRVDAPAGSFRFTARHASHAPGVSEVITHDGATPRSGIEIRLAAGAALAGVVVDRTGAPVPWARVRAAAATVGVSWGRTRETTADEAGKFRIEALPRAKVDAVAANELASSETAHVDLTDGDGSVRLTLDLDGAIAGTVVDSTGRGVEGAQVHADLDDATAARDDRHLRGESELALTDSSGAFAFHGLRAGAYDLRASRSQGSLEALLLAPEVKARTGDTAVRITLPAGGAIAGEVRFADGRTPPAFTVSLGVWGSAVPVAGADGKFKLDNLPPRTYEVSIRGPGFTERGLSAIVVTADKTTDVGTVVVERGRSISGRVVDASGSPVANATVVAGPILWGTGDKPTTPIAFGGPPGAGLIKEATTNAAGEFTIAGVGRGSRHVVADHESLGRSMPITLPSPTESTANLELRLVRLGALEGTVTSGGKRAATIIVTAQSKTVAEAMFTVISGDDGTFRFDRLAPDSYLVSAMVGQDPTRGIGFHGKTVAIASGVTARLDLAIGGGDLALVVTPVPPAGKTLRLALVESFDGTVEAKTHGDLDRLGTTRDTSRSTFGMSFAGKPSRISGLAPGVATVCVCPYPAEVDPLASEDYMLREGAKLPVFCKTLTLAAAPPEQALAIPVEIPAFVPPPKD